MCWASRKCELGLSWCLGSNHHLQPRALRAGRPGSLRQPRWLRHDSDASWRSSRHLTSGTPYLACSHCDPVTASARFPELEVCFFFAVNYYTLTTFFAFSVFSQLESSHSCPEFTAKNEMREKDQKKKRWADGTVWGFTEYSNADFVLSVCGEPVTWMLPSHYCNRSILGNNNGTRGRGQKVRGKNGPERNHIWIQTWIHLGMREYMWTRSISSGTHLVLQMFRTRPTSLLQLCFRPVAFDILSLSTSFLSKHHQGSEAINCSR